jgi:hypothetical protein
MSENTTQNKNDEANLNDRPTFFKISGAGLAAPPWSAQPERRFSVRDNKRLILAAATSGL